MDKQRFLNAFMAWTLAIESKIRHNDPTKSHENYAEHAALELETFKGVPRIWDEDLGDVSECFNWDEIERLTKQ